MVSMYVYIPTIVITLGEIRIMDRKDIFMSGFKSKIGYSFTYKDLNEFEAIINFYEQQCKKQKEVIDKVNEFIKELYDNTDDTTCYEIDKNRKVELLDILKEV